MSKNIMEDIFGNCCKDYLEGDKTAKITVNSDIAETDYLSAKYLFRDFEEMPEHEQRALLQARGDILDIGACAGTHSLYLQNLGYNVTSLDKSKICCEIMEKRGLKNVVCADIFSYSEKTFDTILLLMNGIGIAGTLANLPEFLDHLRTLLKPGGKIIFDSSDLQYLYIDNEGAFSIPLTERYYGEIIYNLSYKGKKSGNFNWFFIDPYTIEAIANELNFKMQFLSQGSHYDYSACLY
ncbi:MAG: class I SAM-dependent methyltransferase [Bacteroidales bacterium]|jgi:2-polyprenyl-3-methyl-5-hydroxy-6-metoxy-1,4-benzoquinol methylase|nr:class I SAM-dependent methyltransferase [Bacteroidales bacterium]MDY0314931.1 methyltransferase domain-containing protein [Bacteroidales bacterium]NLB86626.1 class I SAM-dependent methyltransferase [Bacteroidales bacterium]